MSYFELAPSAPLTARGRVRLAMRTVVGRANKVSWGT